MLLCVRLKGVDRVKGKGKIVYGVGGNEKCIGVGGAVGQANCQLDGRVDREEVNRRLDGVVGKAIGNPSEDAAITGKRGERTG